LAKFKFFPGEKSVSLKKNFTGKPGLNCQKKSAQIISNFLKLRGGRRSPTPMASTSIYWLY